MLIHFKGKIVDIQCYITCLFTEHLVFWIKIPSHKFVIDRYFIKDILIYGFIQLTVNQCIFAGIFISDKKSQK